MSRGPEQEQGVVSVDDEHRRLAALREYGLLDGAELPELEALVRVAAHVAGVPTATINLIDETSQCQIGAVGFPGRRTPRADSMCARQLASGAGSVVVADARSSALFADSPWVTGELGSVVFYASWVLVDDAGHALGTLCVFDAVPHELDADQRDRLRDLAGVIVALFERRRSARRSAALAVEADTQRARYSLAVRELEARTELVRAVLDAVDVALVAADSEGRLTLFNQAATDWHGLPAEHAVAPADHAGHYDLFEADGTTPLAPERVPLRRALLEGEVDGAEIVIAPAGRTPRRVVCSGRSMARADGTPLGAVVAMSDVTADRAQRAALESAHESLEGHRRELMRSNAELADFAAIASHDLRSPLAVIEGYLALLVDVYGADLPPRAREWIGVSRTAVGRMLSLTEALLAYAQAGAGAGTRREVDVRDTVQEVLLDLESDVSRAGARVRVSDPLPALQADPVLFRQLLQNLLANAVVYRDPDRPCSIEVAVNEFDDPAGGAGWTVSVVDNGRGIPVEHREQVFGMFARGETGTGSGGSASRGSGIGLATCARIVAAHGGTIWVEETPGGGATVRFTIAAPHLPGGEGLASSSPDRQPGALTG